jgi:hypothetical protein
VITPVSEPRLGVAGFAIGDRSRAVAPPKPEPEPRVAASTVAEFLAQRGLDPAEFDAFLTGPPTMA